MCVLCRQWVPDLDGDLPEAGVCATCGQPMRLIPSTAKGKYFRRCALCGVLQPVDQDSVPPAPAQGFVERHQVGLQVLPAQGEGAVVGGQASSGP